MTRLSIIVVMLLAPAAFAAEPAKTWLKTETFDQDPKWDAVRNRITRPAIRKQQDFGYQKTNHCGGSAPGEIGGVIWRSVTPAWYGKKIGPFTWHDAQSASGTITCLKANTKLGWQTGSTVWLGFFNSKEQGWRPINFMGFRLETHTDTNAKKIEGRPGVELGYGTSKWTAGGAHVNTTGQEQEKNVLELDQEAMRRVPPDGSKHTWELRYDPNAGADKAGQITFVFDGVESVCNIPRAHREQGATFDRFGIFNNQLAGDFIEVYFDDIAINGEKDAFAAEPKWDGQGNRDLVEDVREYGAQDYGFSPTHHAGGAKAGEVGGRFQSVDPWEEDFQGYYGDRVGKLTLEDKLIARGRFSCERQFAIDSTFAIGWFNSEKRGWPLHDFVGVFFDSLSDTGRIVQPLYGTSAGNKDRSHEYVTFLPDGTDYDWTLEYDPAGANGRGEIVFTINRQTVKMALAEGDRKKGASLDRFGVLNLPWANSKHCVVWLDDLTYTSGAAK